VLLVLCVAVGASQLFLANTGLYEFKLVNKLVTDVKLVAVFFYYYGKNRQDFDVNPAPAQGPRK